MYAAALMSAIFDDREALERVGGDRALLQEVARIFVSDAPEMVAAIARAIAARDPAAVFQTTHKLKGSVANFSAHRAIVAAMNLQRIGAGGTLEGADRAFEALEAEIDLVSKALAAFAAGESDADVEKRGARRDRDDRL